MDHVDIEDDLYAYLEGAGLLRSREVGPDQQAEEAEGSEDAPVLPLGELLLRPEMLVDSLLYDYHPRLAYGVPALMRGSRGKDDANVKGLAQLIFDVAGDGYESPHRPDAAPMTEVQESWYFALRGRLMYWLGDAGRDAASRWLHGRHDR